jgi:hypothetical protein
VVFVGNSDGFWGLEILVDASLQDTHDHVGPIVVRVIDLLNTVGLQLLLRSILIPQIAENILICQIVMQQGDHSDTAIANVINRTIIIFNDLQPFIEIGGIHFELQVGVSDRLPFIDWVIDVDDSGPTWITVFDRITMQRLIKFLHLQPFINPKNGIRLVDQIVNMIREVQHENAVQNCGPSQDGQDFLQLLVGLWVHFHVD